MPKARPAHCSPLTLSRPQSSVQLVCRSHPPKHADHSFHAKSIAWSRLGSSLERPFITYRARHVPCRLYMYMLLLAVKWGDKKKLPMSPATTK